MHQSIRHYMSPSPRTISPEASLFRARQVMHAGRIRHLPVVDGDRLIGILSERDMRLLEGCGKPAVDIRVRAAMTPEPFAVSIDAPVRLVAQTMADHKYGSAVVLDERGRIAGIFCATDALRALSELFDETFSAPTSDRWGRIVSVEAVED